jgi:hypothetical protein
MTPNEWIHIATNPEAKAPGEVRTWYPDELQVNGDELVDRTGELRVPLLDVFWLPIFVMAARSFELQPSSPHAPRVTIGNTVLARESWSVPASEVPGKADDVGAFARDRGMPRRVFFKSPLERKPMFLDTESRVLGRILCRLARQAAADSADARMTFTEMLPGPEECWLGDPDGNRYASEFRFVAVDSTALERGE